MEQVVLEKHQSSDGGPTYLNMVHCVNHAEHVGPETVAKLSRPEITKLQRRASGTSPAFPISRTLNAMYDDASRRLAPTVFRLGILDLTDKSVPLIIKAWSSVCDIKELKRVRLEVSFQSYQPIYLTHIRPYERARDYTVLMDWLSRLINFAACLPNVQDLDLLFLIPAHAHSAFDDRELDMMIQHGSGAMLRFYLRKLLYLRTSVAKVCFRLDGGTRLVSAKTKCVRSDGQATTEDVSEADAKLAKVAHRYGMAIYRSTIAPKPESAAYQLFFRRHGRELHRARLGCKCE